MLEGQSRGLGRMVERKMTSFIELASAVADKKNADIFLYNGEISRSCDLDFIELVHQSRQADEAFVFLITYGGEPDAAYKISRYLQSVYDKHTVIVSGLCKSAGTLLAIGAHELAFSPYGELGPLDIQIYQTDNLAERQSGLTIQESLDALTVAAVRKHSQVFSSIMAKTNSIVSFPTAAKASADLVNGLFAPIFAQIDPHDVGDKARAMRIATEYGRRLAANTKNLKLDTLDILARTYPSHSFVIDYSEASELFDRVRLVDDDEQRIIDALGSLARKEANQNRPVLLHLSEQKRDANTPTQEDKSQANGGGSARSAAKNSNGSSRKAKPSTKHSKPRKGKTVAGPSGS